MSLDQISECVCVCVCVLLTVGAHREVLTLAQGCGFAGAVKNPAEVGIQVGSPTAQSLLKIAQPFVRRQRCAGY